MDTKDTATCKGYQQGWERLRKLTQFKEEQILHNHQDTIFSSLYSDPECILDLYLTLHPEDRKLGITSDQVELITLKNIFLAQRYNG